MNIKFVPMSALTCALLLGSASAETKLESYSGTGTTEAEACHRARTSASSVPGNIVVKFGDCSCSFKNEDVVAKAKLEYEMRLKESYDKEKNNKSIIPSSLMNIPLREYFCELPVALKY